ncbi:hypothetical protein ACHAWF_003204 [Thalassiosira exigua]
MKTCIVALSAAASGLGGVAAWSSRRTGRATGVPSLGSVVLSTPRGGGAAADEYEAELEGAKCAAIEKASRKIEEARRKIVDESSSVDDFGSKADEICSAAIEEFARSAPAESSSSSGPNASTYARKLRELDEALDAPLHVLYLRQLALLREKALASYRSSKGASSSSDYEAVLAADALFLRGAEASSRPGSSWTHDAERTALRAVLSDLASSSKKAQEVQVKSSREQSTAMQFLQQQQQMIQQLQMQLYGQSSPWNVGVAYRVPDTNFNLQGNYQQGRATVQLSCVPDEYAPMLGPNGFTNGVGPGNLGLSLNLSI